MSQDYLNEMVTCMANRGWLRDPAKIPEPIQTVKLLGVMWTGATFDILQTMKNQQWPLPAPGTKKEPSACGAAGMWRTPRWSIARYRHKTTWKKAVFEWETSQ